MSHKLCKEDVEKLLQKVGDVKNNLDEKTQISSLIAAIGMKIFVFWTGSMINKIGLSFALGVIIPKTALVVIALACGFLVLSYPRLKRASRKHDFYKDIADKLEISEDILKKIVDDEEILEIAKKFMKD